ncbi:MAG: AraC family transcriptional regulator, partial [Clostridia bacterium]|nr:AraC family transcriptional regulator [Clostridia bacterium]
GRLGETYTLLFLLPSEDEILALTQPKNAQAGLAALKDTIELLLEPMGRLAGGTVSAALADASTDWPKLGRKLSLMSEMLKNAPEAPDYVCQLDARALCEAELARASEELLEAIRLGDAARIRRIVRDGLKIAEQTGGSLGALLCKNARLLSERASAREMSELYARLSALARRLAEDESEEALVALALEMAERERERRELYFQISALSVIRQVDDFIDRHYADDISLGDIARHIYLSAAYVSRMYKRYAGQNVVDRIKRVRTEKAAELLRGSNRKVYDIATQVGYHSSRYFTTVFRSVMGVSPVEYREGKERTR